VSVEIISIPDSPDVLFTTTLDSVAYDMKLQWNPRDEAWYLSLGKQNQDFLFKTKVTTNTDLLQNHRAFENCPKGVLVALDNMKFYGRITRDGWSSGRWSLYYITEDSFNLIQDLRTSSADMQISIDAEEDTRFTKSATRL
jgi:hypothetical protein